MRRSWVPKPSATIGLARLVRYRGPWTDEEFSSYHPEGRRILEAFARGVNAYIASRRATTFRWSSR